MAHDWSFGMHPWILSAWGMGMMLVMLVFWGLVIAAVVLGIRWLAARPQGTVPDRALDVFRERYARGEIGKEEFDAKKRELAER